MERSQEMLSTLCHVRLSNTPVYNTTIRIFDVCLSPETPLVASLKGFLKQYVK